MAGVFGSGVSPQTLRTFLLRVALSEDVTKQTKRKTQRPADARPPASVLTKARNLAGTKPKVMKYAWECIETYHGPNGPIFIVYAPDEATALEEARKKSPHMLPLQIHKRGVFGSRESGEEPAVIFTIDQPDEQTSLHKCCGCLKYIGCDEYFAGDYYCRNCVADFGRYPLQTTHGGIAP